MINESALARKLLAAAPGFLRVPAVLSGCLEDRLDESPADVLLAIAEGCLHDDPMAMADAELALARLEDAHLRPNLVQDAAAWHILFASERAARSPYAELLRAIDAACPAPYPLFESLLKRFPPRQAAFGDEIDVLSCQHLLGSAVPEYVAIRRLLPKANFCEIIGKPYSTSWPAIKALEQNGFVVNRASTILPDRGDGQSGYRLGNFDSRHHAIVLASVKKFFREMPETRKMSAAPILVIDDGGALISAVGQVAKAVDSKRPIVCIEQTQRGLHAARPATNRNQVPASGFAVINVAQSISKLVLESKLIAESVLENVSAWIQKLGLSDGPDLATGGMRFGIVGYGSVGESVAASLRSAGATTRVYDLNRNKIAAAWRHGFKVALSAEELLENAQVVIAATGGSWLSEQDAMTLHDGVVLASASSGDSEFQRLAGWDSKQFPVLSGNPPFSEYDLIHGEILARQPGSGNLVHILNAGFPVNFNGSIDPIAPEKIQLTRALMLAAVLQVVGYDGDDTKLVGETGVFNLSDDLDRYLFDESEHV